MPTIQLSTRGGRFAAEKDGEVPVVKTLLLHYVVMDEALWFLL